MPNDPFHSAEWLRSLTLSERISSLRKAGSAAELPFDRARARSEGSRAGSRKRPSRTHRCSPEGWRWTARASPSS